MYGKQKVTAATLVAVIALVSSTATAQAPEPVALESICAGTPSGIHLGHEDFLVTISPIVPRDLVVSDAGVFALDTSAFRLIEPNGQSTALFDDFVQPWDSVLGGDGNFYVTDRGAGSVWAFGPNGENPRLVTNELLEPTGITWNQGGLVVNDTAHPGRIVAIHPITGAKHIISEEYAGLDGITASPDGGTLFVTDPVLNHVVRVDMDGQNKEVIAPGLNNPSGCSTVATPGGFGILVEEAGGTVIVDPAGGVVGPGPDVAGPVVAIPNERLGALAQDFDVADDFDTAFGDDRFGIANMDDDFGDMDALVPDGDDVDDGVAFGDDRFGIANMDDGMEAGEDPPFGGVPHAAVGLLVIAGGVGIASAARNKPKKYDPEKDPYAGSVDMVPKDPCEELRKQAEADAAAADAAAQAAADAAGASQSAADAAAKAQAAADAANKELNDAEKELKDASVEPDTDDYVEDEEGRIDEHDLRLKNAASKAAWAKYQNGEISAQELEAEWERLGDRDAIKALREADEKTRAERKAKAEQRVKDAKADAEAKNTAAQQANADANAAADKAAEAEAASKAAAEKAAKSKAAADECEKKAKEAYAAAEAKRRAEAAARAAELEELENQPPVELESREVVVGGGGGKKGTNCCPTGIWVGYGYSGGGIIGFGYETSWITFVCVDRPCCYVTMQSTTWRFGLALGGEGNAIGGVAVGPTDPDQFAAMYKDEVSGTNADLSLGVPISKAGKMALKSAKSKKLLKTMQKLGNKKVSPKAAAKDIANVKDMVKEGVAKEMVKQGKEGKNQNGMVVVPIGPALQVGVWYGFGTTVYVTDRGWCD